MNNYTPVLGYGFIGLVDSMGDDTSIVQAARVSYGRGTKAVNQDRSLIRYLMRNQHWTPFEMVQFKFHVSCPISIARQWLRHRTGSFNEYSLRYSEAIDAIYVPTEDRFTVQSKDNKQGSGTEMASDGAEGLFLDSVEASRSSYRKLIESGVNRETARGVLPMNQYTEFYWSVNLRNLLHFINLRIDPHAQQEIRDYAHALAYFVEKNNPDAWDAWSDYCYNSAQFSRKEIAWLEESSDMFEDASPSEIREFYSKVGRLNQNLDVSNRTLISAEAARCLLHGATSCY
jgi:thymidylate synthase (FAD)